jgi:hypothetical protein
MERRLALRLKAQFRSSFSSQEIVGGEGMVVDLSYTGCRITTVVQVPHGTSLEVRLILPDDLPPLTVESCIVRWSRGHEFGVQFLDPRDEHRARLAQFVGTIQSGPSTS